MATLFVICLVMVVATFAPEIFAKATEVFRYVVAKVKSLLMP